MDGQAPLVAEEGEVMRYLKIAAMVIGSPLAVAGFLSALFPLLLVSLL